MLMYYVMFYLTGVLATVLTQFILYGGDTFGKIRKGHMPSGYKLVIILIHIVILLTSWIGFIHQLRVIRISLFHLVKNDIGFQKFLKDVENEEEA